jgi:hypothetical protein
VTRRVDDEDVRAARLLDAQGNRHWRKRIVRAGPNTLQPYRKKLFAHVTELSRQAGWEFGGTIAGLLDLG